jgi:hypothetical protein
MGLCVRPEEINLKDLGMEIRRESVIFVDYGPDNSESFELSYELIEELRTLLNRFSNENFKDLYKGISKL